MAARTFSRLCAAFACCVLAYAHPMGNFSVNRHARWEVLPAGLKLTYVLELAEQPAFELIAGWKLDAVRDAAAVGTKAAAEAAGWAGGLRVSVDGVPVAARLEHAEAQVTPGTGGLPVLRVVMDLSFPAGSGSVEYEDTNYAGRAGWSEIVVAADPAVRLEASTHGAGDRSGGLTSYPEGRTEDAPRDVRAKFRWSVGAGPAGETAILPKDGAPVPAGSGARTPAERSGGRDYLSRLLGGGEVTPFMLAAGLCVAFGLGAMHALSPGHGKTIVAAYLVGSRGTFQHALLLGGLVTFTHTISVFALGIGVLLFENYIVPGRVIPVLGAVSGLSIVAIGAWLLYRRAGALRHQYQHAHGHAHHHHPRHDHDHHHHDGHGHSHVPEGEVTMAGLIALGVSGGMVPCPSALVLLLTSVALGRVALGLGLLTAFSAGLAVVLIVIGAAVLYAKHLLPERTRMSSPAFRYVPVVSAGVVVVLGLVMTGVSLGWIGPAFAG